MLFDDGVLYLCTVESTSSQGLKPTIRLVPTQGHYFGERTIGYNRQYAARGVSEQIDMLVRIWQDRSARIGMHAVVNGEAFIITNVQHTLDEDGLRVTDLTLSREDKNYEIIQ